MSTRAHTITALKIITEVDCGTFKTDVEDRHRRWFAFEDVPVFRFRLKHEQDYFHT